MTYVHTYPGGNDKLAEFRTKGLLCMGVVYCGT